MTEYLEDLASRRKVVQVMLTTSFGAMLLNGKNVSGPPPRPLDPYKLQVAADGKILVAKS